MLKPDEFDLCAECVEEPEDAWSNCQNGIHCVHCCPDSHWDEELGPMSWGDL